MIKPLQSFKKISSYELTRDIPFDSITQGLENCKFIPCSSQDVLALGFASPYGDESQTLVIEQAEFIILRIKRESRKVPTDAINNAVAEKVLKLETAQQRKLKKTEKDSIKDEVRHNLMPRAFSKFNETLVLIDKVNKRLYVNEGAKRAEDALALIRKACGSLPVIPMCMKTPIEFTLTDWVSNHSPAAGFTLGKDAKLMAVLEDGGVVAVKKQDLSSDEVVAHIEAGKRVTSLTLDYQERIGFTIETDFTITRVKFSNNLLDQNDDISSEEEVLRMDADCTLLYGEMKAFMASLVESLGGLAAH